MTRALRTLGLAVAALVAGGLGYQVLGASPATVQAQTLTPDTWPQHLGQDHSLAEADTLWAETAPWGAAPVAAEENTAPPPPPPPTPVGVAKHGNRHIAIFQINGNGVMRASVGTRLPGGGYVQQISGRQVIWLDAEGKRQTREIFNNFEGGQ